MNFQKAVILVQMVVKRFPKSDLKLVLSTLYLRNFSVIIWLVL